MVPKVFRLISLLGFFFILKFFLLLTGMQSTGKMLKFGHSENAGMLLRETHDDVEWKSPFFISIML